jgi:hypothetical protein
MIGYLGDQDRSRSGVRLTGEFAAREGVVVEKATVPCFGEQIAEGQSCGTTRGRSTGVGFAATLAIVITPIITPTKMRVSRHKPQTRNPAVTGFFYAPERTRTSTR